MMPSFSTILKNKIEEHADQPLPRLPINVHVHAINEVLGFP